MRRRCPKAWIRAAAAISIAAVLVFPPPNSNATTQPNLKIKLVSQLSFGGSVDHSDIWVWEDPVTLHRYAVLGEYPSVGATLYIADVTNPLNPFQVSTITNVAAFDFKVRYPYLYTVDGDASNVDGAIYDITNPASPVFVNSLQSAHNITIADNGYIYFSYQGVTASNLNPDPTNPVPIWDDNTPVFYYGHDVTVVANRMYDFNGYSTNTNVYDITAFNANPASPPVLLKSMSDPFIVYPHNGWPTVDGNYLLVTDELSPSNEPDLIVWDISDVANPAFTPTITDWYMDDNSTIHNVMIRDNLAYVSYYAAGVKVFDLSTPGFVTLLDEYDTSALSGDGYVGAWGIYCLFNDYFYASDMQNGLFIFELVPEPSLWRENGIPVASDAQTGTLVPASDPEPDYAVPDGSGGAIILFDPEGGDRDIYAQRVDVNGNCLWSLSGVSVFDVAGDVTLVDAVADELGGVVVLCNYPTGDIHAQWIDGTGTAKYLSDGIEVLNAGGLIQSGGQSMHLAGSNQFAVVWTEGTLSATYLRCQRYDDTGTAQWTSPVDLATAGANANLEFGDICSDGTDGFIIAWEDDRNASTDIYAQHIDGSGIVQWADGGIPVASTSDPEARPLIAYVGGGRMIAAWTQEISGGRDDVLAAKLEADGTVSWTSTMSSAFSNKEDLQLAFDGSGGVFAAWEDNRVGSWDIYATHFHNAGGAVSGWPADGLAITSDTVDERSPTLKSAGDGTMVVAWARDALADSDIYATKIDGFGAAAWPAPGTLALCARPGTAYSPSMAVDSNGDVIIAWRDARPEGAYAQRIESSCGTLGGNVPPMITMINDTPGDAGGFVDITWSAAGQDGAGLVVQDYDVLFAESPQYGWNATGVSVSASGQSSYTATVPSVQDGTPIWYLVVANGGTSTCTWESFPSSGVSVDDPPSNAPQNLTVQPQSPNYLLTWQPPDPVIPDLSHYNVYRGIVSPALETGNRANMVWMKIGEATDPSFVDDTATPGTPYEWTVAAEDAKGGEGPWADPDTLLDTSTGVQPPALPTTVSANFPNPFTGTTELRFTLHDDADVTVNVYDVAGRRVAGMALGGMTPGEHRVPFDGSRLASGIYFYKVRIGAQTFTRKMGIRR